MADLECVDSSFSRLVDFIWVEKCFFLAHFRAFCLSGLYCVILVIRSKPNLSDTAPEAIAPPSDAAPRKLNNLYGFDAAISALVSLAYGNLFLQFQLGNLALADGISWLFFALFCLSGLCAVILGSRGVGVAYRDDAIYQMVFPLLSAMVGFIELLIALIYVVLL